MATLDTAALEARRQELIDAISGIGDLRAGSLKSRYRKCGKQNCHCAAEGDPGHGPQWSVSRLIKGRMHSRAVPLESVEQTRRQIAECRRLRALVAELIEVGDALSEQRLAHRVETGKRGRRSPGSRRRSARS